MESKLSYILMESLENLNKMSFISFKWSLNKVCPPPKFSYIPQSSLEEADVHKVTDLIIQYYTTQHAPGMVIKVLEDINERQMSLEFQKKLKKFQLMKLIEKTPGKNMEPRQQQEDPEQVACSPTMGTIHRRLKRNGKEKENQLELFNMEQDVGVKMITASIEEADHPCESSLKYNQKQGVVRTPLQNIPTNNSSLTTEAKSNARLNISKLYGKDNSGQNLEATYDSSNMSMKSLHNDENAGGLLPELNDNIVPTSSDSLQSCVPKRHQRGQPRPNIKLAPLKQSDLNIMQQNHNGKAHVYAKYLFQHFVSFNIYQTWTRNTNFDGSFGKNAIPKNLRDAILKWVRKQFTLTKTKRKNIRDTINCLLRTPRTSGWKILM
ncbi:uncharacterized protein O3C94_018748 [Discoglossus pictus]